jgi:peroxiredoxin
VNVGAKVPQATVVDQDLQPVEIATLTTEGALLLSFYLYDWTGT